MPYRDLYANLIRIPTESEVMPRLLRGIQSATTMRELCTETQNENLARAFALAAWSLQLKAEPPRNSKEFWQYWKSGIDTPEILRTQILKCHVQVLCAHNREQRAAAQTTKDELLQQLEMAESCTTVN